jgi:uncharacterized protein (DUF1501 family)
VHWVLGGGVKGGKVHADWTSLDQALMTYPSDVPVKTDYRSTLGAVCRHLEPDVDLARLFPGFQGAPLPLYG